MQFHQGKITVTTHGRGTYHITNTIENQIRQSGVKVGLCHLFIHHTSASLIITENADRSVRGDLETILQRLAPDDDPEYEHTYEGEDDMSAHVRSVLTQTEITLPVTQGRADLGTWQGIYLYEHRLANFERRITVTVYGK